MVGVWVDHLSSLVEISEHLIVTVALLQVLVPPLIAPSNQVDSSVLSGNRPRVKRYFKLHLHLSLLKILVLKLINVSKFLVPLEGVNPLGHLRLETVFDVVVNPQVGFNKTGEVL